jgi:hypothetical protein
LAFFAELDEENLPRVLFLFLGVHPLFQARVYDSANSRRACNRPVLTLVVT